jgi:hypothetical protein
MTYQIQSTFDENFKIIGTLNPSPQNLTTSYVDVPPSHIDYKPSPNSSYVLFQLSISFNRRSGGSTKELNSFFKLQYSDDSGSTWTDWGDNTECYVGSEISFVSLNSTVDIKWALNVTGWSAVKRLRVVSREDGGSDVTLHRLEEFYPTSAGTSDYGCSVSCYSVE